MIDLTCAVPVAWAMQTATCICGCVVIEHVIIHELRLLQIVQALKPEAAIRIERLLACGCFTTKNAVEKLLDLWL